MADLGQSIKKQREAKNMTLEELSSQTKISLAVLRDIENGKFDRYKGEEAYVKMYLKKISNALNMDNNEITDQYIELTKEIALEEFNQKDDLDQHNQDVVKKNKKFSFSLPQLTRKPSVYEDKSHVTIIRSAIILGLVCLVIVIVWYGIYSTRSKVPAPSFDSSNQVTVDGDVEIKPQTPPAQIQQDTPKEEVKINKVEPYNYKIQLPKDMEEFTFKVVFGNDSWSDLKVNGTKYSDFDAKVYKASNEVEIKFKTSEFKNLALKNGYSKGHKFYINNQEIVLEDDEQTEGVTVLKIALENE